MSTLEDSFTKLLGRQPEDSERQTLFRARDAFNIKNNDALWLLLAVLGQYQTLYSKIPGLIAEASPRHGGRYVPRRRRLRPDDEHLHDHRADADLRSSHAAVRLNDGRVFIFGHGGQHPPAELFIPAGLRRVVADPGVS